MKGRAEENDGNTPIVVPASTATAAAAAIKRTSPRSSDAARNLWRMLGVQMGVALALAVVLLIGLYPDWRHAASLMWGALAVCLPSAWVTQHLARKIRRQERLSAGDAGSSGPADQTTQSTLPAQVEKEQTLDALGFLSRLVFKLMASVLLLLVGTRFGWLQYAAFFGGIFVCLKVHWWFFQRF